MLLADIQKRAEALLERRRISFPYEVMQEDAHRVEPNILSPSQFAVYGFWVEGFRPAKSQSD